MAVGDAVSDIQLVDPGAYLTIQPPAGQEWIIHNVYHEGSADLYFTDGTNYIRADYDPSGGAWLGYVFHLTNSRYLKVKNTELTSKLIGYDGVVSKST